MGDIFCSKCSEPWDSYEVYHEFEDWEKEKFLKGSGCPSCHFGQDVKGSLESDTKFRMSALEETDDPDAVLDRW